MFVPGRQSHVQRWIDETPDLFGWLLTPRRPMLAHDLDGLPYGVDNECFVLGEQFDPDRYLRALDRIVTKHTVGCKFATAPDIVGDAVATLRKAEIWLPRLRSFGVPAALVAQDGLEDMAIPWSEFDALFIGGSTEWKLSQAAIGLIHEARRKGKWVHVGRVNGRTRISHFWHVGCVDSFDGSGVAIAPQNEMQVLVPHMRALRQQLPLLEDDYDLPFHVSGGYRHSESDRGPVRPVRQYPERFPADRT